jgi:hypothetical protein
MFFRAAAFSAFHDTLRIVKERGRDTHGADYKVQLSDLMIAGGVAGFIISFIEAPIDLIKIKLQSMVRGVHNTFAMRHDYLQ